MASSSPVTPMMPHIRAQATWAPTLTLRLDLPQGGFDDAGQRAATALACASSRASTMTRTSGSVPAGRRSTRPVVPQLGLHLGHRVPHLGAVGQALGLGDGHVDQPLGHPLDQPAREVGQRAARPPHQLGQRQAGQHAVARGRLRPEDDVARLLAAQAETVGVERGQHVAVAHVRLEHRDPARLHGQAEPEVGHDGDHHRVAGQPAPLRQVEREQRQQDVTVDHRAGVVDRDHPVGVAVEASPTSAPVLDHRAPPARAGSVDPHLSLMFAPSGESCSATDLGAQFGQHQRRHHRRRAVGAVDHHLQPVESAALQTPPPGWPGTARPPPRRRRRGCPPRARWAGAAAGPGRPAPPRAPAVSRPRRRPAAWCRTG